MTKTIRVNVRTGSISCEETRPEYLKYGNRGLIGKVMTEEVNPTCDPFGAENKFILCTGLLAGTTVSTAHRLSVGCKSPLTGGIKESNSGGTVAKMLSQHGIKMVILEDLPSPDEKLKLLRIKSNGEAELIDAEKYAGIGNYKLHEMLHEEYGKDVAIASIGPAGEKLSPIATVQCTDFTSRHPARAAARGGIGAVMGSKKIKALIVDKPDVNYTFEYADKNMFNEWNKKLVTCLGGPFVVPLTQGGTVGNIEIQSEPSIMPVRNFSGEYYGDKTDPYRRPVWIERVNKYGGKQGLPCQPGCLVKCSNIYNNEKGEMITGSLEYETVALLGPNCDISDLDFCAEMDRVCDDIGIDTVELGGELGILMDEGVIPWGDIPASKKLVKEMVDGSTDMGKLMLLGAHRLGKAINAKKIPTVKGQCMAGYEPRNMKGIGVTYATTPMGADHTAGITAGPGIVQTDKAGKVQDSKMAQLLTAASDNFMCSFGFFCSGDLSVFPGILQGALGGEWTFDSMVALGAETIKMERAWNLKAGLTAADDKLPDFFYTDPSPATNSVYDITPEEMQEVFDN